MTAKDVVHTWGQERRKDHFDARGAVWRALIDRIETPAGPDGHEVVFHLTKPEPIMLDYLSTNYTAVIRSKKRWDAAGGALADFQPNEAGIKAMQDDPTGTGPFKFLKRAEAQYIQYESPGYKHWRITPEFPELQIFFVPESSTRLAMLLTKEVHVAEIPRDLQRGAEAKGMKVLTGTTPAIRLVGFFGGNYLPSRPEYDATTPVTNVKVREAMNLAINRAEVNKVFFGGRAELMMQTHSHPKFPGWEASWPERFEKAYGYDPARAKKLLAEAGYPNGFSITHHSYPRPGLPEMQDIAELINGYWRAIGIDMKFEPIEDARHTALRRDYKTVRTVWLHTGSFTEPTRAIFVYHFEAGRFHGYDDQWFQEKYKVLEGAPTAKERDNLIREMGERCFQIYCTIPLFWAPFEFMVNPEVVSEWKTPGVFSLRDYEHAKAAR
jgi:peptide/nickel transport system substrate-binding protein